MTRFLLLLICAGFADSGGGVEAAAQGWWRRLAWRRRFDDSCVQLHALCYDIIGDDAISCNIGEIQILAYSKLLF